MRFGLVALLLVAVTGCGGSGEEPGVANSPAASCETPAPSLVSAIAEGVEDGLSFTLGRAAAYRSPDFEKVYFIAAEMSGPGLGSDSVGVWATTNLTTGPIFAVDGMAKQFTVWPDGDKSPARVTIADAGVDEAKSCL